MNCTPFYCQKNKKEKKTHEKAEKCYSILAILGALHNLINLFILRKYVANVYKLLFMINYKIVLVVEITFFHI